MSLEFSPSTVGPAVSNLNSLVFIDKDQKIYTGLREENTRGGGGECPKPKDTPEAKGQGWTSMEDPETVKALLQP